MGIFSMIGKLTSAVEATVDSAASCVQPLANSMALASQTVELHAQELHADTEFTCTKKSHAREAEMKMYQAELAELTEDL